MCLCWKRQRRSILQVIMFPPNRGNKHALTYISQKLHLTCHSIDATLFAWKEFFLCTHIWHFSCSPIECEQCLCLECPVVISEKFSNTLRVQTGTLYHKKFWPLACFFFKLSYLNTMYFPIMHPGFIWPLLYGLHFQRLDNSLTSKSSSQTVLLKEHDS